MSVIERQAQRTRRVKVTGIGGEESEEKSTGEKTSQQNPPELSKQAQKQKDLQQQQVISQLRYHNSDLKFLQQLLSHISILQNWIKEDSQQQQKEGALEFAKKIVQLFAGIILTHEQGAKFIVKLVTNFLSRKVTSLSFKNDVLELVAYVFVYVVDDKEKAQIVSKISDLVNYDFPMNSTDLQQDSPP
jgi:hypothetical protein